MTNLKKKPQKGKGGNGKPTEDGAGTVKPGSSTGPHGTSNK
jgi:hypothetical protein